MYGSKTKKKVSAAPRPVAKILYKKRPHGSGVIQDQEIRQGYRSLGRG